MRKIDIFSVIKYLGRKIWIPLLCAAFGAAGMMMLVKEPVPVWNSSVTYSVHAVSYTHLDVYKRQGIYRDDTSLEGNFGAFTTNRTGNAMVQLGCESVLVGHCEERADRLGVLASAGVTDERASAAVNVLMNQEIRAAQAAGLSVLYCVGENSAQQARWRQVLGEQLTVGLAGVDRSRVRCV